VREITQFIPLRPSDRNFLTPSWTGSGLAVIVGDALLPKLVA